MKYAKAILAALFAFATAFGVAMADGHPWQVSVGLGVTAALLSGGGVYQIPNAPAK